MAGPVPAWAGLAVAALWLGSCKGDLLPIHRHSQTPGVATCSARGGACRVPGLSGSGCRSDEDPHEYAVKCDSGCGYWRGRCGQSCCVPRAQTPGVATCREMGGACRVPGVLSRCHAGETWREFDIKCDSGCGYWLGMCGQSCCLPASAAGDGLAGSGGAGNVSSGNGSSGNASSGVIVSIVAGGAAAAANASAGPGDTGSGPRSGAGVTVRAVEPSVTVSTVEPDLEPQAAFKVDDIFSTSTDITASNNASLGVVDFACLFGVVVLVATVYRCSRQQPSDQSPPSSDVE